MRLEKFLDHELRKDTMDVVILDEQGNDITKELSEDVYNECEVINVRYYMVACVNIDFNTKKTLKNTK